MRNSELDFNFRFECLARVPRRIKRHLQYIPHVNSPYEEVIKVKKMTAGLVRFKFYEE